MNTNRMHMSRIELARAELIGCYAAFGSKPPPSAHDALWGDLDAARRALRENLPPIFFA